MASTVLIPNCPYCGSERTTAAPLAGPDTEYHCQGCGRGFNASQV